MILIVDNEDSFTYMLADYIKQCANENEVKILFHYQTNFIQDILPYIKGLVISPGPGRPEQSKAAFAYQYAIQNNIALLGVCLGHQWIGYINNMPIVHSPEPLHGYTSTIMHLQKGIFKDIPNFIQVMRYHSLIVSDTYIPNHIEITAKTEDGLIMAMQYINKPVYSVQFHPESVLTNYGLKMVQNWIDICYLEN
ncbi:MAG: aminodeoxychorismate/anthranilate synthase component II [Bacteroidia bacterium]|nr:aminodeoxychorismate/anthranilate synthase component II [Bacteroidia bacterium]MDW8345720.1 aminodeoxychorismate/anthranilate synthase component II [Bacteroidia bacterium]